MVETVSMPELPEVETIVRDLCAAKLAGKKILRTHVLWTRSIAVPDVETFCKTIKNQTIEKIERRGKFLVFSLSVNTLLVHLRMTGKFSLTSQKDDIELPHECVQLFLDDGRVLRYQDQRKFGKWYLLKDPQEKLAELGLEPLSDYFTLHAFQELLKAHSMQIKPFLLNQRYVSGLGNIYVDEALWEAKIHPQRRTESLSKKEVAALHTAIPLVLQKGIEHQGTTLGSKLANYFSVSGRRGGNQHKLNVFRRDDLPCPRCQTIICKTVIAQRGTHFCPNCQK